MRYEKVKIQRDTQTTYHKSVFPWEVPILEYIFEDGNVTRLGEYETTPTEYPEAAEEFNRLVQAYKADPKSGTPYVAIVYGDAGRGVRELRKAIDAAKAEASAAEPRSAKRKRTARHADPLMA